MTSDLSDISDVEDDKEFISKHRPLSSTPILQQNHKLIDINKSVEKSTESVPTSVLSLPVSISRDVTSHTVHHQYSQAVNPSPAHSKPKIWSIAEIVNSEKHHDSKVRSMSSSVSHPHRLFTNMHHPQAHFSSISTRHPEAIKTTDKHCEETALNLAMVDQPKSEKATTGSEKETTIISGKG